MFEFARWLGATPLSTGIVSIPWLARILLTLHMLTSSIVFGSVLMIVLRIHQRGVRADRPFDQTWRRFAPWLWYALATMALTGMVMAICEPLREVSALSFWLKMMLIVVGVVRPARAQAFGGDAAGSRNPRRHSTRRETRARHLDRNHPARRGIGYDKAIWGVLSPKNYL